MEQAVAERPLSQDQEVSQLHLHHNGTLNSSGIRCENDPSGRWYSRRWTGLRGTLSSGPFAGDRSRQDRSSMAVCRDNLRGSCARGASCKYQHSESDRHDGSKFYRNEPENLVAVANSGNSQYRASVNNDSRTRFSSRGGRSRSPCRRFQIGRCFNGTSCPYLHSALTRTYDSSLEQQRVDRAVRDPGFGEGNRDNTIRMSQHCDEANKENSLRSTSFSVERRSRSPCRNYQRGRCIYGASCKRLHIDNALGRSRYDLSNQHHQGVVATSSNSGSGQGSRDVTLRTPQVHEEVNMHNNLRTGAFSREPRNRSPCPNFLSGKCYRGASCVRWHPVTVYDRTRYDSWSTQQHQHQHQHQHQGVSATSRAPNIDDSCRDMHVVNEQKKAWSTRDDVQFAGDREGADVESRSWSSERQRSRSAIDFGGDKLIREVCLQFTKGRCNRGELCRYLHGYHAYASSNWNKPTAEAAGVIRNDRGTNQHANTMMAQEHDDVKNYKTSLGNSKHTESSFVSSDVCLDKETIGLSVRDTVELKIHDQKGDASAMDGRRCDIPGENIVNNNCSAEGQEDISLWSRPFKRRRSRSPYAPRDEFHCRNRMKFDSRVDLRRDRCYNVARFQYPDRRSYKYERPINHANSLQRSRGGSASVNPSYAGKNYKPVAPEGHDEVTSQGLQLDQGPRGSLGSDVAVASKKNEAASARCVLQPSHTERNDEELANDSIAVGSSERAVANGQKVLESDLTHSCGEDHISPTNIDLSTSEKEGNAVTTMEMCLESNEKPAELMPTIKTYSRKKSKKKLRSVSSEETIKEGVNNDSEQMPTSSLVETSSSKPKSGIPADIETSASENNYKKENKKRKKKISESVSCETMKEEVIDAPKQGVSSSSLVETSLHNPAKKRKRKCKNKNPESVSCNENMNEEAANASKQEMPTSSLVSAAKDNDSENMLMDVFPVKPQGNGCMTNVTVDNVESVLVTKELLVDNAHSHSVQSLPKSLAPNASKKLLVLDVNGLLADIVACYSRQFKPDTTVSAKGVFKRPFCDDFLKFCFLKFNVGIWSSRTRKNVNAVVDYLMKSTKQHLLFCWDQSHCTTTGYKTLENTEKPLVLKELKYLWDSEEENCPWEKRFYNETNTVLLDDSPYKALRNPPNTAIFPYPYTYENVEDKSLGPGGDLRVYLERLAEAENVQKFIQENPFGQEPITKSHKSWSFYSKIVGTYVGEQEENANITPDS